MIDDEKSEPTSILVDDEKNETYTESTVMFIPDESLLPPTPLDLEENFKMFLLVQSVNQLTDRLVQQEKHMLILEGKCRANYELNQKLTEYLNLDHSGNPKEVLNIKTGIVPDFEIIDKYKEDCFSAMQFCFLRKIDSGFIKNCFDAYHFFEGCDSILLPDLFATWLKEVVKHSTYTPFCIQRGGRYKIYTYKWEDVCSEVYWNSVVSFLKRGYEAFWLRIRREWAEINVKKSTTVFPTFDEIDMSPLLSKRGRFSYQMKDLKPALIANYVTNSCAK